MQNQFQYKSFGLAVLFQFVKQTGDNFTRYFYSVPGSMSNQPSSVLGRWQKPGDNSDVQRFTTTGNAANSYFNFGQSDVAVLDASFIRLKNLSLSWSLPAIWMQKSHIEGGSIFLQAQNLFTITGFKAALDPEGLNSSLPQLRVITAGLHFTF